MKKVAFILTLILAFSEIADAQSFYSRRRDRTLMFSYGVGFSTYHGDLHDVFYDGLQHALGPSLGVGLRKKFGSQLSVRLDLNWYQIGGDDADGKQGFISNRLSGRDDVGDSDTRFVRNLNFRSRNLEVSALAIFNLIPVDGSYSRRPIINPYIIAGIARTTSRPKTYLPGEEGNYTVNLWEYQTEAGNPIGENKSFTVIPLGIGIRLKANQYIDILLEGGRRFTFTDYLDDVSTVYPSRDQIIEWNGGVGSPNADIALQVYERILPGYNVPIDGGGTRGNPEANDSYYIFSLRLEMYLPDNFLSELFSPSRRKPKFR
ncbi:hypothetical protein [Roseivirga sp.]|uniref:hypothetical protein n=1 Tax=Roseivirga sp. TaxID=1964215 RepID=UPI003B52D313